MSFASVAAGAVIVEVVVEVVEVAHGAEIRQYCLRRLRQRLIRNIHNMRKAIHDMSGGDEAHNGRTSRDSTQSYVQSAASSKHEAS